MKRVLSSGNKRYISPWLLGAVSLLFLDAVLVSTARREYRLAWSSVVLLLVLAAATRAAFKNGLAEKQNVRLFWLFLAGGSALWMINPVLGILYAAGYGVHFPDPMLSASVLFLHTVLMLAAVAARPHLKQLEPRPYGTTLNFMLLLFFCVFIYVFFLVPGQYLNWDGTFVWWFSLVYFLENSVLTAVTATLAARAPAVWRSIYLPLLGASALYTVCSLAANLKVARDSYTIGWLDLLNTVAACAVAWVALRGRELAPRLAQATQVVRHSRRYATIPAMLTVAAIPVFGLWELSQSKPGGRHTIRMFAVLVAVLLLTVTAFIREYLAQRGFARDVEVARAQLHLAMQSGKSIGWDLSLPSGEGTWFGDLESFFGIATTTYIGQAQDFYRFIHKDDRQKLRQAYAQAAQGAHPFAAVFRLILPERSTMWVASRGEFYYQNGGQSMRMLGVAVDITEQKQAEAALSEKEDKLRLVLESAAEGIYGVDVEGRYTFANPAALRILGHSEGDLIGRKIHESIHHTHADGSPYPESECPIAFTLRTGKTIHSADDVFWKKDGTPVPVEYWSYPQRRGDELVGSVVTFIDITERRKAEEALRESEMRFRNVANHAPVLLWMAGADMLCHYFNQTWLDFTGRPLEAEIGNGWLEGVHPDDLKQCLKIYTEAFNARRSFTMEYRLRRHDGEYRSLLDTGVPRFTPGGIFEGYIGSAVDVTEVRRAEKEIALANERLNLALEAGRAGVWDLEIKSGTSTSFGDQKLLTGNTAGPHTLQEFWERVYPEDRGALRRSLENAKWQRSTFSQEFRVLWPDGSMHRLHTEGKFLYSRNGEPERMLGITIDVTQRKQAEEALQKSEEEFSLAFEAARLGWWVWNEDTGQIMVSEGTKAVFGLSSDFESEISLQTFLNSVHPEDRERVYRTWRQAMAAGNHYYVEYRVVWPDGTVHWAESRGHTNTDAQGRRVQMIGVSMDITERKQAEETLRAVGGRLIEAQEQERIRIARELHDDVCQRLAILGIEIEKLKEPPRLSMRELAERTEHLTGFTTEIARDLQALSHELHSSKMDILGTTPAMKSFCNEFSRQHQVEIEFTDGDVPALPRDVSLCLYRVLQEALHNAVKHSGVKRFFVELRGDSTAVELVVRDFGNGFDPESIDGRGLGLISMRERVNLVKGTFSIESLPRWGTLIRARVPVEEVPASRCA